jgi:hypothetical protein
MANGRAAASAGATLHTHHSACPPSPSCSRARGNSGLLFFALVAFGVGGLILTLAAKPIALDCAGKPHAMRMKRHIARVAKQYDALVIETTAGVAWA